MPIGKQGRRLRYEPVYEPVPAPEPEPTEADVVVADPDRLPAAIGDADPSSAPKPLTGGHSQAEAQGSGEAAGRILSTTTQEAAP